MNPQAFRVTVQPAPVSNRKKLQNDIEAIHSNLTKQFKARFLELINTEAEVLAFEISDGKGLKDKELVTLSKALVAVTEAMVLLDS